MASRNTAGGKSPRGRRSCTRSPRAFPRNTTRTHTRRTQMIGRVEHIVDPESGRISIIDKRGIREEKSAAEWQRERERRRMWTRGVITEFFRGDEAAFQSARALGLRPVSDAPDPQAHG